MSNRALQLPCSGLGWVLVNASGNGSIGSTSTAVAWGGCIYRRLGSLYADRLANGPIAFEDFFSSDVRATIKKSCVG